ncbi:hypothetical protein ACI78V_20950 [Geodermatophilus sp. SYSU D00742]
MTEYQPQPHRPGEPAPRGETPPPPVAGDEREETIPLRPVAAAEPDPTILGFPPEPPEGDGAARLPDDPARGLPWEAGDGGTAAGPEQQSVALAERPAVGLDLPVRLVVLRRPERIGGSALLLAGLAANASLWMPWGEGLDTTGLALVWRGIDALPSGPAELLDSGLWQPPAVVLGAAVLFFLGLLLFRRARTHRFVGVLALFVSVGPAAAVLALLADTGWDVARLDLGTWFAAAVPVLGLLGALKAMLTTPHVTIQPR